LTDFLTDFVFLTFSRMSTFFQKARRST
jgi:hypothetical protein